ncbi:unnamed protein product [Bemisia tabaci]|uniref:Uncharacterized protein n=1 Tax=Bemisia tabaci TaxID=7038 RepID=A0A9P0EXK1_BEMTA|nr:unnamed protein product [Bemisia tabaci]
MLATEKGTSLENKVDQILDMMRVLNARQLNFAQRLNQITALVSNHNEQAPPAESKATKAPAEKEPANPATTPGIESPLPTTEHLRKESSTQTTLPNLPGALENDSKALVNQLIPFDEEIVDVVAEKCIESRVESWGLAETIIQKAINDPECSIACAALSRKLTH